MSIFCHMALFSVTHLYKSTMSTTKPGIFRVLRLEQGKIDQSAQGLLSWNNFSMVIMWWKLLAFINYKSQSDLQWIQSVVNYVVQNVGIYKQKSKWPAMDAVCPDQCAEIQNCHWHAAVYKVWSQLLDLGLDWIHMLTLSVKLKGPLLVEETGKSIFLGGVFFLKDFFFKKLPKSSVQWERVKRKRKEKSFDRISGSLIS